MTGTHRYFRSQRLRRRDIDALLASGQSLRRAGVSVRVRSNTLGSTRFGFIIPRRVVPRAVDRNRLKRVLREWFRCNQQRLGGRDILVRLTEKPAEVLAVVVQLLAKLS